ncbi:RTC5 [Candida margitis]|uniref:RTC5 n=1 Tax=Candida margitis TaxID=1775924 RepID=UPI002227A599|nr:RTC5 [Candida margitis]KAI5968795.1 RTC5 [Candida margitis]
MGQTPSTNQTIDTKSGLQTSLPKSEVYNLFYTRCLQVLKPSELAYVKSIIDGGENQNRVVSRAKFQFILNNGRSSNSEGLEKLTTVLFPISKRLGQFPFLRTEVSTSEDLTLQEFVISLIFILGKHNKILDQNFDFVKLLFISLSGKDEQEKSVEDSPIDMPLIQPFKESDEIGLKAKKVDWKNATVVSSFDSIAMESLMSDAESFVSITTLLLVANSIQLQKQELMEGQLASRLTQWNDFETYSISLLKFINPNFSVSKLVGETISFNEFAQGVAEMLPTFYQNGLKRLGAEIFTLKATENGETHSEQLPPPPSSPSPSPLKKHSFTFTPTKLVSIATLSYITSVLKGVGSNLDLTTENVVKLYAGSESGFSIRSLETKIFKWQAPTLLIVSGKRVKQKTVDTNRRYQKFDEIYPKYFLKQESHLQPWQHENDRLTYCVVVREPWQSSNKKNFGDESTTIISVHPRADCYKSIHSEVMKGKSIYFNNQGMGLGFGNLQPLNKNGKQKYYPGDVSLTIEANLEFAVFRHLALSKNNATNFFKPSIQSDLATENFEDRFTITDLEVWGIGSMKELDEQRQQWEWEEKQANARQSVNVRSMGEERAFLEMAGLVGNHGSFGSG